MITSLSISSNVAFNGTLADGAFSFDAHSITLAVGNGSAPFGSSLVFDIGTENGTNGVLAPIPEPGTILLLATSLTGLGVAGWRKHVKRQ